MSCARRSPGPNFVECGGPGGEGKVLKIANQDFKALRQLAGETVKLTGDLKGDTVTVTSIEKAM
jgi:hypothetical protein